MSALLSISGEHNPFEQRENNEFLHNGKENIHNWKHRLSKEEITSVREKRRMSLALSTAKRRGSEY